MAELKNTFTGGKMDKDTDERILQNGVYRSALNVSVSTSEDSDVGAAQNILGNTRVTDMALHRTFAGSDVVAPFGEIGNKEFRGENYHVASIADPQTNMLYRFIHTASIRTGLWMDRIIQFDPNATDFEKIEIPVFVDVFKVESQADIISSSCVGGSSNIIELDLTLYPENIRQIRWGMKVELPGTNGINADKAVVEHVDYLTSIVYVRILPDCFACQPGAYPTITTATDITVTFYGDRNLNFGSFENNEEKNYGLKTITGLNIIDGMIFWTDNFSEPKKINIKRSIQGSNYQEHGFTIYKDTQSNSSQKYLNGFIHHTLLINSESLTKEEHHIVNTCGDISGCTDPTAFNYSPLATIDDGNCIDTAFGCTDIAATNYDPAANTNDGSCAYAYDLGCTDPLACNYSAIAIIDDGLCAGYYGCTDATAFNYDAGAGCDDGSCVPVVLGCTDPTALQYDPFANTDDGSCLGVVYGCTDNTVGYFPDINGAANPAGHPSGQPLILSAPISSDGSFQGTPYGYAVDNFNPDATIDDGSCTVGVQVVPGCTDPLACNYNPTATQDDGTCLTIYGCTDATAYNYDPAAQCDDGSCGFCGGEPNVSLSLPSSSSNKLHATVTGGATPYTYQWYEGSAPNSILQTTPVLNFATLTPVDGTYYVTVTDANGCQTTSAGFTLVVGCMDPTACDYNPNANIIFGVTCTLPDGCTDPTACNYDATAVCDDGNCDFTCYGCTNSFATNYNAAATVDDGSCLFGCQTNVISSIHTRLSVGSVIELTTTMCNSPNGASAEGSWVTGDVATITVDDPNGANIFTTNQTYPTGPTMVSQDAANFGLGIVCNNSGNDITGMTRNHINGLEINVPVPTVGNYTISAATSSPFTCTTGTNSLYINPGCMDPNATNYDAAYTFHVLADCTYPPIVPPGYNATYIGLIPYVHVPDCGMRHAMTNNWSISGVPGGAGPIDANDWVDINGNYAGTAFGCTNSSPINAPVPVGEYVELSLVVNAAGQFNSSNYQIQDWTGVGALTGITNFQAFYMQSVSATHLDLSTNANIISINIGKNQNLTHVNLASGSSANITTFNCSCDINPPSGSCSECGTNIAICVDDVADWATNAFNVTQGGCVTFVDTVVTGNACDPNEYNGEGGAA